MRVSIIVCLLFVATQALGQSWDTIPILPDHYRTKLAAFEKEKETTGKILFLGNSITEGGNFKLLIGDTTVVNRGIGGDITFGVINRLGEVIRFKPSKIFILIGINDLHKRISERVILQNMFAIINSIHAESPKTAIYVQSILPVNPSMKDFPKGYDVMEGITMVNTELSNLSKRLKYTYVDLHKHFRGADGLMEVKYSTDGLHLGAAGYELWMKILKDGKHL